jgi:hypothetical protein
VTARLEVVAAVKVALVANKFVEVAAVVVERVIVVSARFERPETVRDVSVPSEVRDEAVTPEARVLPVRLAAATEPAEPVTDPEMAFVTVRSVKNPAVRRAPVAPREPVEVMLFVPIARVPPNVSEVSVPTLVRDEAVTPAAKVEPVSEPAGAEPLIEPLIVFVTERLVVVALVIVEFADAKFVEVAAVVVERPTLRNACVVEAVQTKPEAVSMEKVLAVAPVYVPAELRPVPAVNAARETSEAPTVAQDAEPVADKERTNWFVQVVPA